MAFVHRTRPAARSLAAVAGALLVLVAGAIALVAPTEAAAKKPRPNIVLITTDDQPAHTVTPEAMPRTNELLVGAGTSFTDYIVTTPLCCPSRATTMTGQYGHNNGVLRNEYGDLKQKKRVLPRWLQGAGYETAHIGKFLNGYEAFVKNKREVAPGWDRWFTQLAKRRYYNWKASLNGKMKHFGERNRDHVTQVTNRLAGKWTRRMARRKGPFYLQLDYFAPHGARGRDDRCRAGPNPAPRDEGRFADEPLRTPPSFNEANVSDKPSFIAELPRFDDETVGRITRRYRCVLEAMYSVDRGIGRVYRTVKRAGQLNRTVFAFTSDNGYFGGEHRLARGKRFPYEENIRMPLTFLVPPAYLRGNEAPSSLDSPVANIDLAPTLLDLARAEPCKRPGKGCRVMDGRSMLPLLKGKRHRWPADRAFIIELSNCNYRGARFKDNIYFEYGRGPEPNSGECEPFAHEHYDLDADPGQLENLYPAQRSSPAGRMQRRLARKMDKLRECAGVKRRDPKPQSGVYCE